MMRDGNASPLFVIAYGLDRLDALEHGEPVTAQGYEIGLPDGTYRLEPDGTTKMR